MTKPLDFQSIILNLLHYWADQGCLIAQPYYTQVGAGTMNPATFLRVLGPEPWNVVYVEPSVRPDDGRYGENPNRLQQHTQMQVILKPDPGDPQGLYLRSLEALGIDPRSHDIRFVEDNWESPALGAWGLGWEVWLDGQEITQFTYFQQAGSLPCDPVSVEITYGLERIAMALQNVRNFKDIQWNSIRTYGDVNLQGEQEHSRYYFEVADVERLRQMYRLFEEEALSALDKGLVLPAHDYLLKCSHTFNILDTRGAVGVTERQAIFGRMRDTARKISEAYLAERQRLEFPWLTETQTAAVEWKKPDFKSGGYTSLLSKTKAPFLLEIGTEELPAADLESALTQLRERVPALLKDLYLTYDQLRVMGTPRRLVVEVDGLACRQPDRQMVVKGPPANRAFDAQGVPTKAAEGFAASKGLTIQDLKVAEVDGGQYVVAEVFESGKPAVEVLSAALASLVGSIKFDKSMRWNSSGVAFSRPIRWLLALLEDQVVPFEYAGLRSGNTTRGLRFMTPAEKAVVSLDEYHAFLKSQGILVNENERRAQIERQVSQLAQEKGGSPAVDQDLLDEVTNLVEAPTALTGSFDPEHLKLPQEVLISVMKKHQRYFPVIDSSGALLPYFIVIRNGDRQFLDVVADGNEQVIRARFADASFFINEDRKHALEDFLPRLGTLTFQVRLGSMLDKSRRIEALVEDLMPLFHLSAEQAETTRRAARLCKADLVTSMVVEMTSLAGVMGRYYALHSGESEAVAQAIFEHILPRSASDQVAASLPGLLVGLADRLDSLAGLFAAGLAPSGTKDPFAQRRAALGLVQSLTAWDLDFDLRAGLRAAADKLPIPASEESLKACAEFITGRLQNMLQDNGYRYDQVAAVLAAQAHNPAQALRSLKTLQARSESADWKATLAAYARCVRITRDLKAVFPVRPDSFTEPAEKNLFAALQRAEAELKNPASLEDFFKVFEPMIPAVNAFFDAVLVMSEDPVQRENRLGMLQRIAALAGEAADFSRLEGF